MLDHQLPAFCLFALIASVTPGPNNLMLLASGVRHGFARSLPALAGICLGLPLMLTAGGAGMQWLFSQCPVLHLALKYAGAGYLLFLAWQMAQAAGVGEAKPGPGKPLTFIAAAALQWLNPKAWIMATVAVSSYLPHGFGLLATVKLGLLFGLICLPGAGVWLGCGSALQRMLRHPRSARLFNRAMAALLLTSLYPVLMG